MKLIEALKKVKDLQRKASDLKSLVSEHCAISNLDTPKYPDQKVQVDGWIQAYSDVLKEILSLRVAIQRTNLGTAVTIEIGGKAVKKTIAEWIHRRRDLAGLELAIWSVIGDRGIKEGMVNGPGGALIKVEINRFYDPDTVVAMRELYASEPSLIDGTLEIINAVTDLQE